MRRTTTWFLVALATLLVLSVAFVAVALMVRAPLATRGGVVLRLDLSGEWPETDSNASVNALLGQRLLTLHDLVGAVDAASSDPRVQAIHARLTGLATGWAKAHEIRAALLRFRETGKRLQVYLEGGAEGSYFVASAANDVWMLEAGSLRLDGLRAEVDFYGGTLAKAGIVADIEQVAEYKNAADVWKRADMTEAHREAVTSLLDGIYAEFVSGVAASLGRTDEEVDQLVAAGPYTARSALDAGLVDALGYEDEAEEALLERLGDFDLEFVDLEDYLVTRGASRRGPLVAVVFCAGTIVPGESGSSPFTGDVMGAETIAEAIRTAVEDDDAEAVILRVDSPGGSPTASDLIWRATERTRAEDHVPVVASMSDVAASGGYWIAMGADHVVASPATITGSIGIYGGKYVTHELQGKLGLNTEVVERGPNAGIDSTLATYTPAQRAFVRSDLEAVYRLFLAKAADGRSFESPDDVDAVGRGRVWTGRQALERGLVDELGGLREAVAAVRRQLDLDEDAPVRLRAYPRNPTLLELLRETGPAAAVLALAGGTRGGAVQPLLGDEVRRLAGLSRILALLQREGVVAYMPYHVRADE